MTLVKSVNTRNSIKVKHGLMKQLQDELNLRIIIFLSSEERRQFFRSQFPVISVDGKSGDLISNISLLRLLMKNKTLKVRTMKM